MFFRERAAAAAAARLPARPPAQLDLGSLLAGSNAQIERLGDRLNHKK